VKEVDVLVVGAGIHGAGVAQAAAAAGYSVLVLEKNAVGSGTSSKSSKLIHGGLRYLESFQFSLVRKSLKERNILSRIAPELVNLQAFYIPVYKNTKRRPWQIRLGLTLYAFLGGLHKHNFFKLINKDKLSDIDGLNKNNLQKVYRYYDGQTNDKKLTEAVMASAQQLGANLSYPVEIKTISRNEKHTIIEYCDGTEEKTIQAKVVVNATGPWVKEVNDLVTPPVHSLEVDLVQGTHIIIDAAPPSGIYYLEAPDQRAVFVIPYEVEGKLRTMLGTTEKLFKGKADEVRETKEEVQYLLEVYKSYFVKTKEVKILQRFVGLRVLPINDGHLFSRPRDTVLHWAAPNILTLYGGKLTAYRSTASLVIKKIQQVLGRRQRIAYSEQLMLSKTPPQVK